MVNLIGTVKRHEHADNVVNFEAEATLMQGNQEAAKVAVTRPTYEGAKFEIELFCAKAGHTVEWRENNAKS